MADDFVFDRAALDELLRSPAGPVGKLLLRKSIVVQRGAKRRCPVDTGRLRSSVDYQMRLDGRGLVVRIGTDVDYAAHIELGTRRMRAQPFLRPALDDAKATP